MVSYNEEQVTEELWKRALLRENLWPQQKQLHDFLLKQEEKITVFNCPRRFGKSFTLLNFAVMMCMQNPGFKVKYGAPTAVQADEIIHDTMPVVLLGCPDALRPDFMKSKKRYLFHHANGDTSELQVVGLEANDGNGLRGSKANLVIIDEAGFVNKLTKIIESIALPLLKRMDYGKVFICSTPSEDASHDFFDWIDRAQARRSYLKRTIYDDLIDGQEGIDEIIETYTLRDENDKVLVHADDNPSFQREYLCERLSNPEALIFPEFLMLQNQIVHDMLPEEYRPEVYKPMVAFDWGWTDFDGGLYGFVDFEKATLHIEAETWTNYTTASDLGKLIKGQVSEIWPHIKNLDDIKFWADNDMKQIANIRSETNIRFRPVDNTFDKDPSINSLRTLMANGRVKINKNCPQLIYQLENGMWQMTRAGNKKNDFIRNKKVGHCDLISALLYLYRQAEFKKNPYPLEIPNGEAIFGNTDKYVDKSWDKLKGRRYSGNNAVIRK
jgi:hypothetical protein